MKLARRFAEPPHNLSQTPCLRSHQAPKAKVAALSSRIATVRGKHVASMSE